MALAAHAADSGETKEASDNTNKQPERLAENHEHDAYLGLAVGRPGAPTHSENGGIGARKNVANGSATAAPSPKTTAAADGVNVPARGVAKAEGHQDDGAASSSADEEKKAGKIRAQMSVLMVGFFEIIRQVSKSGLG